MEKGRKTKSELCVCTGGGQRGQPLVHHPRCSLVAVALGLPHIHG